jgi:hypothetical protein
MCREAGFVELFGSLDAQIGLVARVEANAHRRVSLALQFFKTRMALGTPLSNVSMVSTSSRQSSG